jgi:hypothetical protein
MKSSKYDKDKNEYFWNSNNGEININYLMTKVLN